MVDDQLVLVLEPEIIPGAAARSKEPHRQELTVRRKVVFAK